MDKNFAFLASTRHSQGFDRLRKQVRQVGVEAHKPIWVAELDAKELSQQNGYSHLQIVDRCLHEIDASERFFLLVGDSFGSSISIDERALASSFTELELFYAVIREKPITLLYADDARPTGDLAALIEALKFGIGGETVVGEAAILEHVKRQLQTDNTPSRGDKRSKRRLSGVLALTRHLDPDNKTLFREMQFLAGESLLIGRPTGDLELARKCLDDAKRQEHTDRKMSRVWLALRELMGRHYSDSADPKVLALWREALQAWSQFAGWKSLHAHLYLGHIACLGSLTQVVEREGVSVTQLRGGGHCDNLAGAFGSVYYSLSKIAPRSMAGGFIDRSFAYIEHGLSRMDETARSGLLAIRGSARLRQGNARGAREDYAEALSLAERYDLGDKTVGELTVELAWAELLSGRLLSARRNAEAGFATLVSAEHAAGFETRALRKLAIIRLLTASPFGAYRAALSAARLIEDAGLEDQKDSFVDLALRIEKMLSRKKRTPPDAEP